MSLAMLPGIRVYTHAVLYILPFLFTVFILSTEYSAALLTSSECPTCRMLHYLYVFGTPHKYAALLTSSECSTCMRHYLRVRYAPHVCGITYVFGTPHMSYAALLTTSESPTCRKLSRKERRGPRRSSMLRQTLQIRRPKPENLWHESLSCLSLNASVIIYLRCNEVKIIQNDQVVKKW